MFRAAALEEPPGAGQQMLANPDQGRLRICQPAQLFSWSLHVHHSASSVTIVIRDKVSGWADHYQETLLHLGNLGQCN